ncbi:DUF4102 domain-containing protein [Sinimarinibacterium sp. CAU 1509]|uniref:tyrosine-type recombinase/integrase n=1 Tax=Sinimarinibacterium sp. CAU 1509 TaxID=2562283 RepID=UPI0010AD1DFA|nr:integrase arm-type DNA-binding domain-containing protein [Sinimarinibacterium sp. CAU 1509]TJY55800.1 DUF4102 domain-containing protein [Sinimarinibacterium sp. CAU 1509]
MSLTDTAIRKAKPRAKPWKLTDGGGLYVHVMPNGSKLWRYKYRFRGGENTHSLGAYPAVGLKRAREGHAEARRLLAEGIDPNAHRTLAKASVAASTENSFQSVAIEWLAKFRPTWTSGHADKIQRRLERDVFPWIGTRPIAEITAPELLTVLQRIEGRGRLETAHRAGQNCAQVFRYAISTGRAERNPVADLRGAIPPTRQKHHASITDPREIGALLRDLHAYKGSFITACALQIAPLLFVRPGELRHAEWSEVNLDTAEWRIPAEKMKARALHIVPLSTQAIEILRELSAFTGTGRYVFPGVRSHQRPMSENTVLAALRRMGYTSEQMTGHGFRSMASTLLNEQGWHRDAIERQLAHSERDKVRGAYNYAEHLPERRKMMQAWADYLDQLRSKMPEASSDDRPRRSPND